ncbi:MAG: TetR/AcrR family transcriptional regulator [Desulfuromonadaceae bacterium]|nr:TetR/AcrR family transcriptional regulator [Desulfuromonadaceae bacterium]
MARELMKKKRTDKSNHIIEIATEVFSEKGYHGALTDEIAERAGISKRSMYYYIGDKDMLYETVMKNLLDQSQIHLYQEQNETESPEKKIRRLIHGMAQVAKLRPLHSIVMRELFAGGENLPPTLSKNIDNYLERFTEACEEIACGGKELSISPIMLAWMIFAFFLHWDITMPFVYDGKECTQRNAIELVGKNINEKLIKEVEKFVFNVLGVYK